MTMDIQTLGLAISIGGAVQVAALVAQHRLIGSLAVVRWWAWGWACVALAFAMPSLRLLPGMDLPARFLFHGLALAGLGMLQAGLLAYIGRPARPGVLAAGAALTGAALAWATWVHNDVGMRRVVTSAAVALLSFPTAWVLRRAGHAQLDRGARHLSWLFLLFGAFFLYRAAALMFAARGAAAFASTPGEAATFLVVFTFSVGWSFWFILMVNHRLTGELQEAKQQLQLVFNASPDAVAVTRISDGAMVMANAAFASLAGEIRSQLAGAPQDGGDQEVELRRDDGSRFVGIRSARLLELGGEPHTFHVTRDITAQKKTAEALEENRRFLSDIIENNAALISVKDPGGRYTLVNRRWEEVMGAARSAAVGSRDDELFPADLASKFGAIDASVLECGGVSEREEELEDPSGTRHLLTVRFPLRGRDGAITGLCSLSTEVTDLKRSEQQIRTLARQLKDQRDDAEASALTDPLTHLPNRRAFDEALVNEFYRLKRSGAPLSLVMLDVDHFKAFNDRYGHPAGDECLRRVAGAIKGVVLRPADVAARYGGEEFGLVLPETGPEGALVVAERVRKAVEDLAIPHADSPTLPRVTASLGVVTLLPAQLPTHEGGVALADRALYDAKHSGRNRVMVAPSPQQPPRLEGFLPPAWTDDRGCGHPKIDGQHQRLLESANLLIASVRTDHPDEESLPLLEAFLADVEAHFRSEEAILAAAAYPGADLHATRHAELLGRAATLLDRFRRDAMAATELMDFVCADILVKHMVDEDKSYAAWLAGGSAGAAAPRSTP